MYDLRFYSEYFFRAQPEIEIINDLKTSIVKERQQLLNESASAVEGLVRSTERIASHDVLIMILPETSGPEA